MSIAVHSRLAGPRNSPLSISHLTVGALLHPALCGFRGGGGGCLNLGPHTCTASILHTELSLLPEKQNSSVCLSVWLLGIISLFHSSGGLWMIVVRSSETLKTREPSEASEADS